jgi:hypothetical protein
MASGATYRPRGTAEIDYTCYGIAASLINVLESEVEQEKFFAELETEEGVGDDGGVVKQQEHNHKSDLEIAELCTDVEVDFLSQEYYTR